MLNELLNRYPSLCGCKAEIENAAKAIIDCYEKDGKLLLCGNGGSCADCEHIVGELMKGFLKKRPLNQPDVEIVLYLRDNYYHVTGNHPGYKHYNGL